MFFLPNCCSRNNEISEKKILQDEIKQVFECKALITSLQLVPVTAFVNKKERRLDCDYLNGTVIEFPLSELSDINIFFRPACSINKIFEIKKQIDDTIESVFRRTSQKANDTFSAIDKGDYAILLKFVKSHELTLIFPKEKEANDFKNELENTSKLIFESQDLLDSCIEKCVGTYEENGFINKIVCDPELFFEITSPPF